jgi:DNA-binding NarL/FixJ family response regulator
VEETPKIGESGGRFFDDERRTSAQRKVLPLVLRGFGDKQVAFALDRSRHTIHSHLEGIYRVFNVRSRAELFALYISRAGGHEPA